MKRKFHFLIRGIQYENQMARRIVAGYDNFIIIDAASLAYKMEWVDRGCKAEVLFECAKRDYEVMLFRVKGKR